MITRRTLLGGAAGTVAGAVSGILLPGTAGAAEPRRYVIGRTHRDRRITAYRIGPADAPSRYVVIGCMHGDESAGHRIALNRMIKRRAPDGVQVWIVPTMNPDGVVAGSRTNARGVDLNRNFPKDWKYRTGVYASGWKPASEPETADASADSEGKAAGEGDAGKSTARRRPARAIPALLGGKKS